MRSNFGIILCFICLIVMFVTSVVGGGFLISLLAGASVSITEGSLIFFIGLVGLMCGIFSCLLKDAQEDEE